MNLDDVEIGKKIRNSTGEEFCVVGIDYVGTIERRGPIIILNVSRKLDLDELKGFERVD